MFWLKKWELLALKLDWDNLDRLLGEYPAVLYKTQHFDSYRALHAHLGLLPTELAKELVQLSWADAPNKVKFRRGPIS